MAVAAVARLEDEVRKDVALLTFGSPVRSLYAWFFPRFFGKPEMEIIKRSLNDAEGAPRWRNLRRCTDPIGGTIFTDPGHEDAAAWGREVTPNALDGSRRVHEVDWIVPDPFPEWPALGDPMPVTKGHSYYDADPPYWTARCELFIQLGAEPTQIGCEHSAHAPTAGSGRLDE